MRIASSNIFYFFLLVILGVASLGVNYTANTKRNTFLWNYNCDYKGNDWSTQYDVRSFSQCAQSCMQYIRNCNHFSFDAKTGICYLKKASYSQPIVETPARFCGEIPNRIRLPILSSNRTWTLSQDGAVKWGNNCTFIKKAVPLNISANVSTTATTSPVLDCGEICKSNVNCNYFHLYQNNCSLYKGIGRIFGLTLAGFDCGYIPARLYNEDTVKKCNFTRIH